MHPSQAIIIDLQLAVRLNPLTNPNTTINRAAKRILASYTLPAGLCTTMVKTLATSPRAYDALMAGVAKLEMIGVNEL